MTALHKTSASVVLFLVFLGWIASSDAESVASPTSQPTSQAAAAFEFEEHVVILLVAGDDPPPMSDEESLALQKKHIEHIVSMGESGKLVAAGPFGKQDDPKMRGILIFNCSLEEASAMASDDPAVKAGRLKAVSQIWYHEKGAVTFPKAKSPSTQPSASPQS